MPKKNSEFNKILLDGRFYFCALLVVLTILLISIVISHRNNVYKDTPLDYADSWTYEDGSPVDFAHLMKQDRVRIHKRTNGDVIDNRALCFFSKNTFFTVTLDGEVIYDFHPSPPKMFGKAYGIYPHAVMMPLLYRDGDLVIEVENVYSGKAGYIEQVSLCDGATFLISRMQNSVPEFILCLFGLLLGFIMVIIALIGRYFGEKRYEIMSMGTFAMVLSIWILSETPIMPLLTKAPVAVHFMDYISLGLLPIPSVLFVSQITENKNKLFSISVIAPAALNILASIVSTVSGQKDYHELLWVSHAILALMAVMILVMIIIGIVKRRINKMLMVMISITISVPLIVGFLEVLSYRLDSAHYSSFPLYKFVLLIFVYLCGIYEFINISELSRKSQYAEIMEKMAYSDGLTGLYNREAFNR